MVSLSILNTHSERKLKEFIKEANKNIRAQISEEIKEERKKFSKEMSEKRKIEKEKRIIKIPKKAKKEDLIKVIMDNKVHFKDIKKNAKIIKIKKEPKQTKDNEIKKLDNEIKDLTPKIKDMSSAELVSLSKKYAMFKDLVGLDNKKHKGIVKAILKRQKELKKPNIPKIIITEEEEPKGGGRADPKSNLPPIPKPTAKIRIVPKKPKAQLGQSGIGEKRKREEGPAKKKKVIDVPRKAPKAIVFSNGGKFFKPKPKKETVDEKPKEQEKKAQAKQTEKPKKKKESRLQRIRRERAEAIKRDKGKVIPEINDFPKNTQKEFFRYLKEENENGFTLEDQKDLFEYMEDLAERLPKERAARQELNQFDKEQMILFNALFPKDYIQYIEVENDITGRKEGIVAEQEKKAAKEQKAAEKKRSQEALKIAKRIKKQEEAEAKQKIKDQKEFEAYMKKNKK